MYIVCALLSAQAHPNIFYIHDIDNVHDVRKCALRCPLCTHLQHCSFYFPNNFARKLTYWRIDVQSVELRVDLFQQAVIISHPPSSELLCSSQGKCDHSLCAMVEFYRGKCDHSLGAMVEFYLQMLMIAVSFFIVSVSSQKAAVIERLPPTVQVI